MKSDFPLVSKGVLADANLLVLLVVGLVNPSRIKDFNRTSKYTRADYDLLLNVLGQHRVYYSTPHVLAEVSNLTDMAGEDLALARKALFSTIETLSEEVIPSVTAAAHACYKRLGFTDAAIASVAKNRGCAVLTDDLNLWIVLENSGVPAINFTHLRAQQMFG